MHRNLANTHGIPTSKRKSSTRRLKTVSRFNARHFTETPERCSSLTYELPNCVDDDSAQIHFYRRANPRASPAATALRRKVESKNESPARRLPCSRVTLRVGNNRYNTQRALRTFTARRRQINETAKRWKRRQLRRDREGPRVRIRAREILARITSSPGA